MELSHVEVEEYLLKIFTGQQMVILMRDGLDVKLVFKQPDNFIKLKAANTDYFKGFYPTHAHESAVS